MNQDDEECNNDASASGLSTTTTTTGNGFTIPRQNFNQFLSTKLNNDSPFFEKYEKPQVERYVWEMRKRSPNTTPASTVLNSPDLTETMNYSTQLHQQIRVGRSPVSLLTENTSAESSDNGGVGGGGGGDSRSSNLNSNTSIYQNDLNQFQHNHHKGLTTPGSPTDLGSVGQNLINDGEIVVFDDIDTNWMKSDKNYVNNDDVLKVTKMIGQLPIAEYEGSPRRIGNYKHELPHSHFNNTNYRNSGISPSLYPPRPPGFPQRISPTSVAVTQQELQNNKIANKSSNKSINNLINIDNSSSSNRSGEMTMNNSLATSATAVADENPNSVNDNHRHLNLTDNDEEQNNKPKTPTFDYLYEFSETRKVLEEFFKGSPSNDDKKFSDFTESGDDIGSTDTYQNYSSKRKEKKTEQAYIGQRLARIPNEEFMIHRSPKKHENENYTEQNDIELYIDSNSRSSVDLADTELEANLRRHSRNFTLSPETTDYDSNCGDLDSLSNDINCQTDFGKLYTSMPVLEDGLSSGHASDNENNISSVVIEKNYLEMAPVENMDTNNLVEYKTADLVSTVAATTATTTTVSIENFTGSNNTTNNLSQSMIVELTSSSCSNSNTSSNNNSNRHNNISNNNSSSNISFKNHKENNFDLIYSNNLTQSTPPPPAPAPHRYPIRMSDDLESQDIQEALKDIRSALQRTKALQEKSKYCDEVLQAGHESPVWIPRRNSSNENLANLDLSDAIGGDRKNEKSCHDDEEADTDLETDRLLGQQRLDDQGFYDEKGWNKNVRLKSPIDLAGISPATSVGTTTTTIATTTATAVKPQTFSSATIRQGIGTALTTSSSPDENICQTDLTITSPEDLQFTKSSPTGSIKSKKDSANGDKKSKSRNKEALLDPAVLIEGVLFRARYLGSTQLVCEGQPTKSTRMMQAEEAVSRIKAPEGESQPSTEVDLFISTEKIMVLNTDLKEIMMDHALRTISYIADIGDLVVLMARRRFVPSDTDEGIKPNRTPKMICHVFESDEAQFIAQSIGQAFQVAYMEFLKANGIEDHSFVKEMDYQEVLNSQEIFGDELEIFAKKELQKEVVVPKTKGEILGVVIVESGWGSMLPTVVIANLMSTGSAARCGQLNIGDQLIAINGLSLVGLPLSTCQTYIRNAKNQTAVKFTVVPCPPVVEVKIKRPNTKYQLGFSVQNGVICSLLRGGIAERGGVRVGHRIIEINNQSVVAVPHEKIVNLLATSVGEILMKTMPTSMFRLLTGQENPIFI